MVINKNGKLEDDSPSTDSLELERRDIETARIAKKARLYVFLVETLALLYLVVGAVVLAEVVYEVRLNTALFSSVGFLILVQLYRYFLKSE